MFRGLSIFSLFAFCWAAAAADAADLIPVEHFARLPKLQDPVLSPDGNHIAMIMEVEGEPFMVSSPTDGSEDLALAKYGEYRPRRYSWASNRHLLLSFSFAYRRYGIETTETRLAVLDVDKNDLDNLVKFRRGNPLDGYQHVSQQQDTIVSLLLHDDEHVLLAMDLEEPNSPGVYRYPLTGGNGDTVLRHLAGIQHWFADASGTVRFGWGYRRNSRGLDKNVVRMVFRASADEDFEEIAEYDIKDPDAEGFGFLGFTEDPYILVIADTNEHGRQAIYKFDVRTSEIVETVLSDEKYDATWFRFADGKDRLLGVGLYRDTLQLTLFDEAEQADQQVLEESFPGQTAEILNRDLSGKKVVAVTESASSPPTYHYFDIDKGLYQNLGSQYPELAGLELSETRPIEYATRDDLVVTGYLTVPKGAKVENLPLIVHPHGGPASRDAMVYDYWVQFFVSRGWAVLQMNFRGSEGFGRRWERAGEGEWGRAMQDDISDGVLWAVNEGIADPARICIVGASYGGYAALQGLVKTPDLYACGVSLNGVSDIQELISDSRQYTGFLRWRDYWRQDNPEEISPAKNAERIEAPVLIAYGTKDRQVEYDQSTRMISALKRHDKNVVALKLNDGDHGLSKYGNRLKFFQAMDGFLQEHMGLGPVPDGAPAAEAAGE